MLTFAGLAAQVQRIEGLIASTTRQVEGVLQTVGVVEAREAGTPFTRFTSTKVQELTRRGRKRPKVQELPSTKVQELTSTRVQELTRRARHSGCAPRDRGQHEHVAQQLSRSASHGS